MPKSQNDNLEILAVAGLRFEGVIQATRSGPGQTQMYRTDCPQFETVECLEGDPNGCPHLNGFRRNQKEKSFWVLCHSPQRKKGPE